MNGNLQEGTASGRLARAATSVGPVKVDCTGWEADVPAEQWSSGKLVSVAHSRPAVNGGLASAERLTLEIILQFDPGARPAWAFTVAAQLVAAVITCDPGLGLTYDWGRSQAKEGEAVIVFTPGQPGPDAEARLEKVVEMIRKAVGEASGIALNGIQVLRAA